VEKMGPGPILSKRNFSALDYPDMPMIRPDNPLLMGDPYANKREQAVFFLGEK